VKISFCVAYCAFTLYALLTPILFIVTVDAGGE
jgi:hypothetical protein